MNYTRYVRIIGYLLMYFCFLPHGVVYAAASDSTAVFLEISAPITPTVTPTPITLPVVQQQSSSSNTSPSIQSTTTVRSCGDTVSDRAPDLFEIRANKNSAALYIAPPTSPYGSFYILYGTKPDEWQYGVEFTQGFASSAIQFTINQLQPNTMYYFKVRAGNGCASGPWSNTVRAQTTRSTTMKRYYKSILVPIVQAARAIKKKAQIIITQQAAPSYEAPSVPTQPPSALPTIQLPKRTQTSPPPVAPTKIKRCILWIFCW